MHLAWLASKWHFGANNMSTYVMHIRLKHNNFNQVSRMVKADDSGPRGPGFNYREGQFFHILNGCHDYCTHDMSNLK